MGKLIAIGEMLIDFTGIETGNINTVSGFEKNPGGAPANVAVCVARLGGQAQLITKLGLDGFGEFLIGVLEENGVDISHILRTGEANTPLAFVTLDKNGEREFSFYRNPSSDLLLNSDEIKQSNFIRGDILHFCSVDLVEYPVKYAHKTAIENALSAGMLICFDPNLRHSLWKDTNKMIETVKEFIPFCHILKMSREELEEISGCNSIEAEQVSSLFAGNIQVIIITDGAKGSKVYFKDLTNYYVSSGIVIQVDATGAGDTFIGTLLFQLLQDNKTPENLCSDREAFKEYLRLANRAAAICVTKRGAIPAMPLYKDVF